MSIPIVFIEGQTGDSSSAPFPNIHEILTSNQYGGWDLNPIIQHTDRETLRKK